jgi:putative CocE/NonD family hydrolase
VGGAADDGEAPLSFFRTVVERAVPDRWRADTVAARDHAQVRVPALITASWYDVILGHDLEHFARVRRQAVSDVAREQTRLIVGPWSHGMFLNVVGALDFGRRAMGGSLDLGADLGSLQAAWLGAQLADLPGDRGPAADAGPRVRLFVQGVNRWRDEPDWPLARARPTPWYLRAGGDLAPQPPGADDAPDEFVFDPNDPCPTCGGDLVKPPDHAPGPQDQAPLLGRPDVLVYTSQTLERDLEVVGPVSAVLHAATTGVSSDFVVKLCDVHPDGRTFNVCDGIVRTTGDVGEWPVDLWATAIVFRAGHRVRVVVSSSDFPRYERNPNTGEDPWEATVFRSVRQTVFHDTRRASHVVLPVIP